jgi:hypothetical protein
MYMRMTLATRSQCDGSAQYTAPLSRPPSLGTYHLRLAASPFASRARISASLRAVAGTTWRAPSRSQGVFLLS